MKKLFISLLCFILFSQSAYGSFLGICRKYEGQHDACINAKNQYRNLESQCENARSRCESSKSRCEEQLSGYIGNDSLWCKVFKYMSFVAIILSIAITPFAIYEKLQNNALRKDLNSVKSDLGRTKSDLNRVTSDLNRVNSENISMKSDLANMFQNVFD
ncbi:MAG: hypothetical protein LE169_00535 [Endomicrobium sp.]|nr:hypothetical protein [Endomicrobium sp.]